MIRCRAETLTSFACHVLQACGVPPADANLTARRLVEPICGAAPVTV